MSIDKYEKTLETVIIEDIFMPETKELLRKNDSITLLESIINYFGNVSYCDDEYLRDIFLTTVLEKLGNDRAILKIAQNYMGDKTKQI